MLATVKYLASCEELPRFGAKCSGILARLNESAIHANATLHSAQRDSELSSQIPPGAGLLKLRYLTIGEINRAKTPGIIITRRVTAC